MTIFNDLALAVAVSTEVKAQAKKPKKVVARGPWASGGKIKLDKAFVGRLRDEFLMLMRVAAKAANYDEAIRVKEMVRTWREAFDDLIFEDFAKNDIYEIIAEHKGYIFKGEDGRVYNHDELKNWVDYWQKKIRKDCWDLSINLSVPIERSETSRSLRGEAYAGHEYLYSQYMRERDRWMAKAKREALKAWKVLEEFIAWMGQHMVPVKVGVTEIVSIEGFRTKIIRFGTGEYDERGMSAVPAALRKFKERAQRVYPWILKAMLPMELRFRCDLDEGGRYHGPRAIEICVGNMVLGHKSIDEFVRVIAHEMGHHVYKTHLTEMRRKLWSALIVEDRGPVDLRKSLACWQRSGADSFFSFLDWLKDHEPVTFVKLEALVESEHLGHEGLKRKISKIGDLEAIVASGKTMVQAPRNPITVYANKNNEEAFCEAFSIAVAIGPRGLLPDVRGWLKDVLPDINLS
jgi:hypothetical protein